MKILWFTNTPSNAAMDYNYKVFGGGWISALETLVVNEHIHEIGICFFFNGTEYKKITKNGINYYGIPAQKTNAFQKIINRHKAKLNDSDSIYIDSVIKEFNPDLIHVFGTENGFGEILINKFDKVLFHLQGLMAPYAEAFFPKPIGKKIILKKSGIGSLIRGITFYHQYLLLKKRAKREIKVIKNWKYFTGRTEWDKNYTLLTNPTAIYYHNEELLRSNFFNSKWVAPPGLNDKKNIVIGTTINPNIYKGLDVIYKVLALLKDYKVCWKIFGLKEDSDLNNLVKKALHISDKNPSIEFYGQIDSPELIKQLNTCHFFVHPSYIDNSPNSVCEAMLLGMPVVSSSVGGIKSLITHNENGFLFNPYDKYELAGLLVYLINNYDKALIAGNAARTTAFKRHSPSEILRVLNDIYTSVYND
jgi:glycosyltransferase involved in cell wall biosynthesis